MSPSKFNTFLMFKLPSAWLCGVRIREISGEICKASVRYRWINQNPFNSMFWAVQGMAAELSTGALVISKIQKQERRFSMLVVNNKASFTKKATGKITFICNEGKLIDEAIRRSLETGEGQTFWMKSIGTNEEGMAVSTFHFEWSVKAK